MGYISKNWRGGLNLSQKFIDKIKPQTALKNRINDAGKKMEYQILRLDQVHNKLKQNHDHIFKKIVDAQLTRNESRARTYAIELQEIRKTKNKIAEAKLAMEQIKLRLRTVSELGDIVITLSPLPRPHPVGPEGLDHLRVGQPHSAAGGPFPGLALVGRKGEAQGRARSRNAGWGVGAAGVGEGAGAHGQALAPRGGATKAMPDGPRQDRYRLYIEWDGRSPHLGRNVHAPSGYKTSTY